MFDTPGPDYHDCYLMGSGTSWLCKNSNSFRTEHSCKLFGCSFRILGYQRWVMWNGSCRQLKSWRVCCSGHTAPREAAFHQGKGVQSYRSHTACVWAAERGMASHCIDVPVPFSVHPVPAGALGDQQTLGVRDSTQSPFLHSLFVSMARMISCALFLTHETNLPSFNDFLFFGVCF